MDRNSCRSCMAACTSAVTVIPAGSPPPARTSTAAAAGTRQGAGAVPNPGAKDEVKLAEAALRSAREAGVAQTVLDALQANLDAKRKATIARQPVAQRLQQATQREQQSRTALEKAEERLAASQRAAEDARAAHARAQEEVRSVTAEVANSSQPKAQAPADAAEALSNLLAAVRSASTGEGDQQQQLQAAAAAAEQVLQPKEEGSATAAGGHGQKRDVESSQETVMGTQDMTAEEADVLMKEMDDEPTPEAKRARLMAALGTRRA